jgi:hypothetical protein
MIATTKTILSDAILVLQNNGWTKRQYVDDSGCRCAMGAIAIITGDSNADLYWNGANNKRRVLHAIKKAAKRQQGM